MTTNETIDKKLPCEYPRVWSRFPPETRERSWFLYGRHLPQAEVEVFVQQALHSVRPNQMVPTIRFHKRRQSRGGPEVLKLALVENNCNVYVVLHEIAHAAVGREQRRYGKPLRWDRERQDWARRPMWTWHGPEFTCVLARLVDWCYFQYAPVAEEAADGTDTK